MRKNIFVFIEESFLAAGKSDACFQVDEEMLNAV